MGEPGEIRGQGLPPADRHVCSLVVASLEIGKALAEKDRVTFRAQGTCMYPNVQPGDVLHVESRKADQVAVGDIAVCRRAGYLFGHRIIGKGVDNGRPYIVTRPDRTSGRDDGPCYDEDVLGIASSIERRGKRVEPCRWQYRWPMRFYLSASLMVLEWFFSGRRWLVDSLARIQRTGGYRRVARLWLAASRANASYVVRLPLRMGQTHELYRPMPPEQFEVSKLTWRGRAVDRWTLALHLNSDSRPAALTTFLLRPPECPFAGWWVSDLQVRVRYRGAGLEQDLISKAEELLALNGVTLQRGKG